MTNKSNLFIIKVECMCGFCQSVIYHILNMHAPTLFLSMRHSFML